MLRTFFLSLLLLCSLAHAQGDPWQALKQAYDASHNLNYQGVLQAQHLKDVRSMKSPTPSMVMRPTPELISWMVSPMKF